MNAVLGALMTNCCWNREVLFLVEALRYDTKNNLILAFVRDSKEIEITKSRINLLLKVKNVSVSDIDTYFRFYHYK